MKINAKHLIADQYQLLFYVKNYSKSITYIYFI